MQVCVLPIKQYGDLVPAAIDVFGVQGLMDVADEVQHEAKTLAAGPFGERGVEDTGGVVGDGGNDAAGG